MLLNLINTSIAQYDGGGFMDSLIFLFLCYNIKYMVCFKRNGCLKDDTR
jgi:hypothetical protein